MTLEDEIETLVGRIAMADRRAFRAFYARTSPKVAGILHHILRDDAMAEDALQEIYVRVWREAGQYRDRDVSAMTWLASLARDEAVQRLRHARRTKRAAPFGFAERLFEEAMPAATPGPEAQAVDTCLRRLPPEVTEMLRAVWFQGLDYAELADLSGEGQAVLRKDVRDGLRRLRECLGG